MPEQNCLVGCINNHRCSKPNILPGGKYASESHSMSPFVKITFVNGQGEELTVGNESCPAWDNHAIIKSFDCSMSTGWQCNVEIFDEQGGNFTQFFDKMIKCMDKASESYNMQVEFGWILADCSGNSVKWATEIPLVFMMHHMEVSVTQGKIKYHIMATDLMQAAFVGRQTKVWGNDKDNKLPLKVALIKLFGDTEPKCRVKFLRKNPDGTVAKKEWEFLKEPQNAWQSDNQNKLSTALRWIAPYRTDQNKGITATWDSESPPGDPAIIFWEDFIPACDANGNDALCVGTFLVNAGNCSNVLDFNPKFNWLMGFNSLSKGGGTSAASGKAHEIDTTDAKGRCKFQTMETGISQNICFSAQAVASYGDDMVTEVAKSEKAHRRANMLAENIQPIEAELVISGCPDRQFIDLKNMVGSTAAIVVINPFHIQGAKGECGEWLAIPGCNEVLSNKDWFIKGVQHSIREGNYTTSLNVTLMPPEIATQSKRLGGRGYQIKNGC